MMNPQQQLLDFRGFKIIMPANRQISLSEMRISTTKFMFSIVSVAELLYPKDVCLLFSEEESKLVVVPSEQQEFSMSFYTDEYTGKKKAVSITHTTLVSAVRQKMRWDGNATYRVPGLKLCDVQGHTCLVFDLNMAKSGKREKVKMDPMAFLKSCPSMDDIMRSSRYQNLAMLPPPGQTTIIDQGADGAAS